MKFLLGTLILSISFIQVTAAETEMCTDYVNQQLGKGRTVSNPKSDIKSLPFNNKDLKRLDEERRKSIGSDFSRYNPTSTYQWYQNRMKNTSLDGDYEMIHSGLHFAQITIIGKNSDSEATLYRKASGRLVGAFFSRRRGEKKENDIYPLHVLFNKDCSFKELYFYKHFRNENGGVSDTYHYKLTEKFCQQESRFKVLLAADKKYRGSSEGYDWYKYMDSAVKETGSLIDEFPFTNEKEVLAVAFEMCHKHFKFDGNQDAPASKGSVASKQ